MCFLSKNIFVINGRIKTQNCSGTSHCLSTLTFSPGLFAQFSTSASFLIFLNMDSFTPLVFDVRLTTCANSGHNFFFLFRSIAENAKQFQRGIYRVSLYVYRHLVSHPAFRVAGCLHFCLFASILHR